MPRPKPIRPGDVFLDPKDGAVTVMRTLPGGRVDLQVERKATVLIGSDTVKQLRQWPRLGRVASLDGMFETALPLVTALRTI